jgi:FKBP-type peptidyl-prolyl cis-trans isomerase
MHQKQQHSRKTLGIIIGCLVIIGIALCILLAGLTPAQTEDTSMNYKTTTTGIRYHIVKDAPRDAVKPKSGSKVVVNYTGWLEHNDEPGQKFDSSYDHGEPFIFVVGRGQVIKGWDESVLDMKVGEKRRVIIPPALGYGARGFGRVIPPNSTLIFDIELVQTGGK